jgi:RNA polymerase sigma-70 factor (ECF subfamily)
MAALVSALGDFDLAEDAMQEAFVVALERWAVTGIPNNPGAWITTSARRKAIDRLRRDAFLVRNQMMLQILVELDSAGEEEEATDSMIPDERLKLIFTCCHPALSLDARVALTLRMLGGLTTPEIAAAFLLPVPTMAQRLVRAKKKIKEAGIPYRIPPDHLLGERMESVLGVLYLVFNEGYAASAGDELIRRDLCREAIRLGRILAGLLPEEPEVLGLLALMLLHDSRRDARTGEKGELIILEEQDRSLWDGGAIEEGKWYVERALRMGSPGPYQIQAAIGAIHASALHPEETDWRQIVLLYDLLLRMHPTPVVELNRAVAVAMAYGAEHGLRLLDAIEEQGELDGYHHLHAARADLLRRSGRFHEASIAYMAALQLVQNGAERAYLGRRLGEVIGRG